ncbi:MAG: Zn-dependent hydrolase [Candidatus Marinimicrobia bacterium]|nr:Zn-dependent hydrolase [Candidatus Neomarinimicrobiota bacterium]|tara:strand:+ start:9587 stop:10282 length:696 start_codon:yes stop_codon:yes gene_type:complete
MKSLSLRQYFDRESCTYTYFIFNDKGKECIIIDPVMEQIDRDLENIKRLKLRLTGILETHVHADHITGAYTIREKMGAPIYYGSHSGVKGSDYLLEDGDSIQLGPYEVLTIHTPGHTKGSVSYYCSGMLFTGDTLFIGSTGRTDFQGGDPGILFDSIKNKLFVYPDETKVYPAHDYSGVMFSTIGEEKRWNQNVGKGMTREKFIQSEKEKNRSYPKKFDIAVPANLKCGKK